VVLSHARRLNLTEAVSSYNFLVVYVTTKSQTCYEDVVRVGRVMRMPRGRNRYIGALV